MESAVCDEIVELASSSFVTRWMPRSYELGVRAGQIVQSLLSDPPSELPEWPDLRDAWRLLMSLPVMYKTWWINLLTNDPVHVFVETTMLLTVLYMIVSRSTQDWREDRKEKLTKKDEEELVHEWRDHGRAPLVPPSSEEAKTRPPNVVVHSTNGKRMEVSLDDEQSKYPVVNFATFDFLGMSASITAKDKELESTENSNIKEAALKDLDRYGVGACGPRGFYGTIDPHLQLEDKYASFFESDGAILYSDGASTCSSTVAAFAKRGDLIVVDEGVYEPLIAGIKLSRSSIKWFKHNDMDDLRRVLEEVRATDRKLKRAPNAQRRFIVVEGMYRNTGSIAPLDQIVALKHEFSCRLILDESFSFGTLGPTGKGSMELFNKRLMHDAEIVMLSLETAMGGIGGITMGSDEVVDHQRLSGSGYCYSAASPPFTASAAVEALTKYQREPDLVRKLGENRKLMYRKLREMISQKLEDLLYISSDELSPLVFLVLSECPETETIDDLTFLAEVVRECIRRGIAPVATRQQGGGDVRAEPKPAIRLAISAAHEPEDIENAVKILAESVNVVMDRFLAGTI